MEIVMSFKPNSCDDIFNGKKRYEVRKTIPKNMKTNTKVYVYKSGSGGVVGEFIAKDAIKFPAILVKNGIHVPIILGDTCLTYSQLYDYVRNSKLFYEIEIEDPVIYETPIPLSEFGLKRPPQSWCYAKNKPVLKGYK